MQDIAEFILVNVTAHPDYLQLPRLARKFFMSQTALKLEFRLSHDCTIEKYIRTIRFQKAMELLQVPGARIKEVASRLGYTNLGSFSRDFKIVTACSPRQWRMDQAQKIRTGSASFF